MPSTTPPGFLHYTIGTNSTPANTRDGPIPVHPWGDRLHQPAAIYDTTSRLNSHASFRRQDYASFTDHSFLPPTLTFSRPAQQPIPSTTRYPSPMSRHARPYQNYSQWLSPSSPVDPSAPSFASQVGHKVWILECKHCRTFLTNRGMKAVLLLRPHVPLYSTDALPVNCSALSSRPPSTRSSRQEPNEPQPRTCECLTQTLYCHGCGTSIGYMIVVPCARCTNSSSAMDRVTNGHRFVFHSSELIASERHYMSGERGILPVYTEPPPSSSPLPALSPQSFLPPSLNSADTRSSSTTSSAITLSYSTMPPLATESPCPAPSTFIADLQKPSPQPLRAGDVLYWHHFAQSGEIPAATDDPRARGVMQTLHDR
ncbi:FAM72 protein-domain-containing protein [Russula dissimulans]|nr:FAM72 protein-domain-containing protein [Russula dissimulans]